MTQKVCRQAIAVLCVLIAAFLTAVPGFQQTSLAGDSKMPTARDSSHNGARSLQERYIGVRTHVDADGGIALYGRHMTSADDSLQASRGWLAEHASALGAIDPDLRLQRETVLGSGGATVYAYEQFIDGLPVEYGTARLLVFNGRRHSVVYAAGRLADRPKGGFAPDRVDAATALATVQDMADYASLTDWSAPRPAILGGNGSRAVRTWKFTGALPERDRFEAYTFFVNAATGALAYVRDEVYNADVFGHVRGLATPGTLPDVQSNPPFPMSLADLTVYSSAGSSTETGPSGDYVLSVPVGVSVTVEADLAGPWVIVHDTEGGDLHAAQGVIPPGQADLMFNAVPGEFGTAQVNAFTAVVGAHNLITDRQPNFGDLDWPIDTFVNINNECNAYFTPSPLSINFFRSGACVNSAYSSVVSHEYGHYIVYRLGLRQEAFGEGYGDCVAILLYDDPVVGRDFAGPGAHVRDIVGANQQYPCFSQIHTCGQVVAGVWWDIKLGMQALLGDETGLEATRQLFTDWSMITMGVGRGRNSATPLTAVEVLTVDDDDGDIYNGTPHHDEICAGFAAHNIGCPGACDDIDRLRVICRDGGFQVRAIVTSSALPDTEYTLSLDGENDSTVKIRGRGWGTTRWTDVTAGEHQVCVEGCPELCETVTCEP